MVYVSVKKKIKKPCSTKLIGCQLARPNGANVCKCSLEVCVRCGSCYDHERAGPNPDRIEDLESIAAGIEQKD